MGSRSVCLRLSDRHWQASDYDRKLWMLDMGQVIVRAWDITGFPEMSQGILGITWTLNK